MQQEQQLQEWVAAQLAIPKSRLQWFPQPGDASFRRYFRCGDGRETYMVALAPPATEKNREFVNIAAMLERAGVHVPHVVAVNYENGYILQNDLGDVLLRQKLDDATVDGWYGKAMQQIRQMLKVEPASLATLPLYDTSALFLELSYFKTWFLEAMLQYECTAGEELMLQRFFDILVESALAQPQVFVHRDYHCRNIMVKADGELATIDFQDAVCGAITYDLVSLLRDCYIVWPEARVRGWVSAYWQQLHGAGMVDVHEPVFQRWFDLMGLQRHIKVLGIFSRLSIRDGKHGYLNDLPTVLRYVQSVAAQQVAGEEFLGWLEGKVIPLVRQKDWGRTL